MLSRLCHDAIDIAILGIARKDEVICSHTAKAGDDIILAMISMGFSICPAPCMGYHQSKEATLCRQVLVMNEIGKKHLVHSGKDISNPEAWAHWACFWRPARA